LRTENKILSTDQTSELIKTWKGEGESIIFTNGCFDILHLGHVDYLQKAKNIGGKLIIGVNSDDSVRRIKGTSRPIVEENSRMRILASLEFVDCVILFDQDTPLELISLLLPDILVKGNDYSIDNIVGADVVLKNGGRVDTISLVEGQSTSGIIDKILESKKV
jgi:rfaE bifunctional protein nucleotidyltransferase chain/domain